MLDKFTEFFGDKWLIPIYIVMLIVLCFAMYECSNHSVNNEVNGTKEIQMQRLREHQIDRLE